MTHPEPYDEEMAFAREAGTWAVAELLNKREEHAARMARAEASACTVGVLIPRLNEYTREGGKAPQNETSQDALGSKEPAISDAEALDDAERYIETWGYWNLKGDDRPRPIFPRGYRSQFAPPGSPPPPPDECDLAAYVERTPGFEVALGALWQVYVLSREPGRDALRKIEIFRRALADRIRVSPWKPPPHFPEICEADRQRARQTDEEWAKSGRIQQARTRKRAS